MTDEVVTRLYRALVEEMERRGHPEGRPVKVSELYQDLVPYRAVRSVLGVELNADYEHALLRLLSGERGLLRLEPAEAREELRREVDAPYPFVGLFRKFSASNVWVNMPERKSEQAEPEPDRKADPGQVPQASAPQAREAPPPAPAASGTPEVPAAPSAPSPEPMDTPNPADPSAPRLAAEAGRPGRGSAAAERAPVQLHSQPAQEDPAERMLHAGKPCAFCSETLPAGRRVRFCPHCGGDQRLLPCPRCDAVLERGWHYCISCGTEVSAG